VIPFSILICVYAKDEPGALDISLASIVHQLEQDTAEIILVKDGPLTNELNQVIEVYTNKYPGLFKVVSLNVNNGLGKALNEGLRHCSHSLVARMDADDICTPDRFSKQLQFMEQHPDVSIIGGQIEEFIEVPGDLKRIRRVPLDHDSIITYARTRSPFNHPSVMFRKEAILSVGSYVHMPQFEDYYLWIRLIKAGHRTANLSETILYFRTGNDMVGRRHGFGYMRKEYNFIHAMREFGFISSRQFIMLLLLRLPMRLLPKPILTIVYKILR
jgi:glycosyltransferase involved in cell wall biosynthesis